MYHIGFDRILVFCVDIPEWKQNNFRKNCGRILKVKIIFNRKSPSVHISTLCWHPFRRSIFVRSLVLSDMFFFIFPHHNYMCRFRRNRKDFTQLWPEKQILVNGRSILSFLFCEGFLSRQTSLCGLSFSKFCPIIKKWYFVTKIFLTFCEKKLI